MLPACTVTFPLVNTAVIETVFVINVDDEIVIVVESEELDIQDHCAERTSFTIEMVEDPLLVIDPEVFTFEDLSGQITIDNSLGQLVVDDSLAVDSPTGQLIIATTDSAKAGLYELLIKEISDISTYSNMFTTTVSVTVSDFCYYATIAVDPAIIEVEYTAGDSPLVINLATIESSFQVDDEHRSVC